MSSEAIEAGVKPEAPERPRCYQMACVGGLRDGYAFFSYRPCREIWFKRKAGEPEAGRVADFYASAAAAVPVDDPDLKGVGWRITLDHCGIVPISYIPACT